MFRVCHGWLQRKFILAISKINVRGCVRDHKIKFSLFKFSLRLVGQKINWTITRLGEREIKNWPDDVILPNFASSQ